MCSSVSLVPQIPLPALHTQVPKLHSYNTSNHEIPNLRQKKPNYMHTILRFIITNNHNLREEGKEKEESYLKRIFGLGGTLNRAPN